MKLFLAPVVQDFTNHFRAVFAGAIAVAINHGQNSDGQLEANLSCFVGCHFGGAMDIDLWADQAVRAMLKRVLAVCVFEYELKLRESFRVR